MSRIRPQGREKLAINVIIALAVVSAGIYLVCMITSMAWVGKIFPGFLVLDNKVVAAAGLPQWPGLQAGRLFYTEVISVEGHPVPSSEWLNQFLQQFNPGHVLNYTFRSGEEFFSLSLPVLRFNLKDFISLFGFYLFNGLAFLLTGFIVFVIRPNRTASFAMLSVGISGGLWGTTGCDLYGPHRFFWMHAFFECFMPAAIVHIAMVFPEEKPWFQKRRYLLGVPYLASLVLAVFYEIFLYHPDRYVVVHNLATLYLGLAMVYYLATITQSHFRTTDMLAKQRTRVIFLGSFIGLFMPAIILFAATLLKQKISFTQIAIFTFFWPVTIGYAILKHNLFDIDTFIKRSIYYFTLTGTVLSVYLILFFGLNRVFHSYGISQSPYFPLIFFLLILMVFNPLRERIQAVVNRVYFRIRYDYRETVEELSKELTSLLNIEEIVKSLLSTVTDTMMIQKGMIALRSPSSKQWDLYIQEDSEMETHPAELLNQHPDIIREMEKNPRILTRYDVEEDPSLGSFKEHVVPAMDDLDLFLILPILFRSKFIGLLGFGRKKSGQYYAQSDLELFQTLANQGAVALSNATSYKELEDLNLNLENLVAERTSDLEESNQKLEASYEKLKELDNLKSQFFSNVGHELRTPLTLSLSPLESMLQGEMGSLENEQKGILSTVHRNALKLLKLINNLLDFSKIEAGRIRLNIGCHKLVPFLKQIIEPFQLAATKKEVDLTIHVDGLKDKALALYVDRERMEKVFTNLLSNAFKFTPHGGKIRVSLAEQDGQVAVSVSDTGPGIPKKDLPRIFERFYQASSKETKRVTGTGIGLSLVKEFTELHGGEVTVQSEVGHGTEFVVFLKKGREHFPEELIEESSDEQDGILSESSGRLDLADLEVDEETPAPKEGQEESCAPKDAPRILIAEDNPDMRRFVRMLLQKQYRVIEARDGREGLELCRSERPDLVLSDVSMPRMTGIEFCKEAKQDQDLRFIPFILLTSRAEVQYRIEGFEAGADEYVGKPFNARELQARIRSLLELRKAEQDLQRTHEELKKTHEELKTAEVQLIHSEKMASLGQLVAGVAHELNNPISFVYGNMNILQEYVESIENILKAYREVCRENSYGEELETTWQDSDMDFVLKDISSLISGCQEGALRTKQIVMDLRTFSRLDEAERKVVDIKESIESTLNLLTDKFKNRIRVHTEFGDLPEVECYGGQVNQVFMNLLSNASQAINETGEIWVRTRFLPPDQVEIQVEDTGEGISPEVLDKIFDPFFTTKPVGSGTGLGLSISYGIIEKHGGNISVKSEPGKGTCFTVLLPRSALKGSHGEEHSQPA